MSKLGIRFCVVCIMFVCCVCFLVVGCEELDSPSSNSRRSKSQHSRSSRSSNRGSRDQKILEANEWFRHKKFKDYFWPRKDMSYLEKHYQMRNWEGNKKCNDQVRREYGFMPRYYDHRVDFQDRLEEARKRGSKEKVPFYNFLGRRHCKRCQRHAKGQLDMPSN